MVSTPPTKPEGPIQLSGITWQTYQKLQSELDNRNLRLTYHRGILEFIQRCKFQRCGDLMGKP